MIRIGQKEIGPGRPCFVIAEVGINHNGDVALATDMIREAARAGADAVKFQAFRADHFVTADAMVYGDDKGGLPQRQIDMLARYEFSPGQWRQLRDAAAAANVLFFASVFDGPSLETMAALDVPLYKIASCDLTNVPLIRNVAATGRPALLSVGMGNMAEVGAAVQAFTATGNRDLVLMQCTSSYPSRAEDANLRVIPALAQAFGLPVGFSDHCKPNYASFAAVALGTAAVEKHFTSDNGLPGVDQKMSLNPAEWRDLVRGIREVEAALGSAEKRPLDVEAAAREQARRSLVAACDIPAGGVIAASMITAKRPGTGIPPSLLDAVVGRRASVAIRKDELITWGAL